MEKIPVLISSCDKFSDLWGAHIYFLNENFKSDYFVFYILTDTNNHHYSFDNVEIIEAGVGANFQKRIAYFLKTIKTDYLILTLDDYFVTKKIDTQKILEIYNFVKNKNISYLRFFRKPKISKRYSFQTNLSDFRIIDTSVTYSVNLYTAIWKSEFLKDCIQHEELSIWQLEVILHKYAEKNNLLCVADFNNNFPILDMVRKGKFLRRPKKFLDKHNVYHGKRGTNTFYYELKLGIRTIISDHSPLFAKKIMKKIGNFLGHTYFSDCEDTIND